MNSVNQRASTSILLSLLLSALACADLAQSDYAITIDSNGNITNMAYTHPVIADTVITSTGDGYLGNWYYYPVSNRYVMWFHAGPYNPNLKADILLRSFIGPIISSQPIYITLTMGWTTSQWTNPSHPPLPSDMSSLALEDLFTDEKSVKSINGWNIGSVEGSQTATVYGYNPEWVFVSIRDGRNIAVYRSISSTSSSQNNTDPQTSGACCNYTTGTCYQTATGTCFQGYTYLGDNTTCDTCNTNQSQWDFGDAPSTYPVLLANNGARHQIVNGISLGQAINAESDGSPSLGANLDAFDDGVQFLSGFVTGQSATIRVTTSVLGTINAWLDLNLDGDWNDLGEQVLVEEPVIQGQSTLSFFIPDTATPGQSYLRVRFNTTGGLTVSGPAQDGEVEDYAVTITAGTSPNPNPNEDFSPVAPANQLVPLWSQPATLIDNNTALVNGWTVDSVYQTGPIIADDWTVTGAKPIQGFRWWGTFDTWSSNVMPPELPNAFHIGIWTDDPQTGSPNTLIWETTCLYWTWAYTGTLDDGTSVFEFSCFLPQDEWFVPNSSSPTSYWTSISAIYLNTQPVSTPWGWLTREPVQGNPAIMIQSVTGNLSQWPPAMGSIFLTGQPVTDAGNIGQDMSFNLLTNQPPGTGGGGSQSGDLNGDGVVDIADMSVLMQIIFQ